MPIFQIDPTGTYLDDADNDSASAPTTVLLSAFSALPGSTITLSASGAYKANNGSSSQDTSTSLVAVFIDANGIPIAPAVFSAIGTSVQSSGVATNIAEDFAVVSGGITQLMVPTGAVALRFSANDNLFSDNSDPNNDFKVTLEVQGSNTSYLGADIVAGTVAPDTLSAGAGNDTLLAGPGDDTLLAGTGNDFLIGGSGNDLLSGGEQRNLAWKFNRTFALADYDYADYSGVTGGGIRINLSDMTVAALAGADIGTDTLRGIEGIRGTRQSDQLVGNLATLSGSNETAGDQHGVELIMFGGSDQLSQTLVSRTTPWVDSAYVNYSWSGTAVNAVFTGSTGSIQYTGGTSQAAGVDTVERIASFGDTRFDDRFDFSGMTGNHLDGERWNYLQLSFGNDTVVGNGDTTVSVQTGTLTSSNGRGIIVQFAAPGTAFTIDMSHLTRNGSALGVATVSNIDSIRGTELDDTLVGGAYDDFESFRGRGGNDLIDGGSGYDRADYLGATTGITIDLAAGSASGDSSVGTDALRSIEAIRGGQYDDTFDARGFSGSSVNAGSFGSYNSVEGRGGNDTIHGNGSTRIDYSASNVAVEVNLASGIAYARDPANRTGELEQAVGQDTFSGVYRVRGSSLSDLLLGGGAGRANGETLYERFEPEAGDDTIDGKDGWDEVSYFSSTGAITVDLNLADGQVQDGMGGVDTLIGIEGILGSNFDDMLLGSDANGGFENQENFVGGKGADTINGRGGYDEVGYGDDPSTGINVNLATGIAQDGWGSIDTLFNIEGVEGSKHADTIVGNAADNRLDGHGGDDTLDGAAGSDWVEYNQAQAAVQVSLALGLATGADGNDVLISIENVYGSVYDDVIDGNAGSNSLYGRAGDDFLSGGLGDDILIGHLGNDRIDGGAGTDTVVFTGNLSEYTVVRNTSTAEITITDLTPQRDGVDQVRNVERFQFNDVFRSALELLGVPSTDSTAPTLISLNPLNGATGVAPGVDIVAGFSESMRRGTGTIELLRGDGTLVESFEVATSRKITIDGSTVTLDPTFRLIPGTRYSLNVPNTAFTDLAGNFGPGTDPLLSFTTRGSVQLGSKISDILSGGADEDDLDGDDGDDTLDGGGGDDALKGGRGKNTLKGGVGIDSAQYGSATGPVVVNLALGTAAGSEFSDVLSEIENVVGGLFADVLSGDTGDNELSGQSGNDGLNGGNGKDLLDGGTGADRMDGGADDDTYVVDDIGDQVIESATATGTNVVPGTGLGLDLGSIGDTVNSSISYVLPVSVENLLLVELAGALSGTGNASDNALVGNESNNSFTGAGGNDSIDGAEGIDTAIYSATRTNYTVTRLDAGWTVNGTDGNDTVINIERLQFADSKLALDLAVTENAGLTVEFFGLMAPTLITDQATVGSVLAVFDQSLSMLEVCQLAIDIGLVTAIAGANTNAALAAMAYRNVVGVEPGAAEIDLLVGYMDGRSASYSQADFMAVVAGLELNQIHVGLVGLQQTGLGFMAAS